MYYFLAHFLNTPNDHIDRLRKLYDPSCGLLDPHIAVVFPVDASIGEGALISHIEEVLKHVNSFSFTLSGFEQSWDHYLYLTVGEGRNEMRSLHDALYTGILSSYLLPNIPYTPHMTIGFFADRQAKLDGSDLHTVVFDQERYEEALREAQSLNLRVDASFDRLSLVSRENKNAPAVVIKDFIFDR